MSDHTEILKGHKLFQNLVGDKIIHEDIPLALLPYIIKNQLHGAQS